MSNRFKSKLKKHFGRFVDRDEVRPEGRKGGIAKKMRLEARLIDKEIEQYLYR